MHPLHRPIPGQHPPRLPALACACLLAWSAAAGAAPAPTLRLFPTAVLEEIKQTGNVAQELESGLQPVIARLDQQQRLYLDSKCDGAEADAGCDQLARQLATTYLEMLQVMEVRLPEMEQAVNHTRKGLEKRLRRELGQKKTAWDLQETLLGKAGRRGATHKPRLRGRSGMRLSDRFRQYYNLVARPGQQGNGSLAVVAADIYLDMEEASELIARTREEISRATLMGELNQSMGVITPQMHQVVAGVKSILFGEAGDAPPADAAPARAAGSDRYLSPLQL